VVATRGCHRAFEFLDKVVEALADAPPLAWLPVDLVGGELAEGARRPIGEPAPLRQQGAEVASLQVGVDINAEAALAALSGWAEDVVPGRANAVQE
jgi:hypothetical protein